MVRASCGQNIFVDEALMFVSIMEGGTGIALATDAVWATSEACCARATSTLTPAAAIAVAVKKEDTTRPKAAKVTSMWPDTSCCQKSLEKSGVISMVMTRTTCGVISAVITLTRCGVISVVQIDCLLFDILLKCCG